MTSAWRYMTRRVATGIARRTGVSVKYLDPADGRMCIALAGPSAPLKAWRTERADRKRAELADIIAELEAAPLRTPAQAQQVAA